MEAQEEVMGSKDLSHIVKGKRTKRQRAPSPLAFAMNNTEEEDDCNFSSPTTSSTELFAGHESTEEEEDMANCLILLAQGHGRKSPKRIEESPGGGGGGGGAMERLSSRRFAEAATTTGGKAGFYVYECKTCNRCFPSFQALGGHRASHKKPKAMMEAENKKASVASLMALSPEEDEAQLINSTINSPPLSLQIPNRSIYSNNNSSNNNKSRVHECSICGSEFSSGQALGGHMRRHRSAAAGPITTNNTSTTMTTMTPPTPVAFELPDEDEAQKTRNVLQLDLNLPAPSEDDHHLHHPESKFSFTSKQQQQSPTPLVFSASALVDCHY